MATAVISNNLIEELKAIRKDLDFIKEHMFDSDSIMTAEEEKRYNQAMAEYKEGKTTSLSKLKKELGL